MALWRKISIIYDKMIPSLEMWRACVFKSCGAEENVRTTRGFQQFVCKMKLLAGSDKPGCLLFRKRRKVVVISSKRQMHSS